MKVFFFFSNTNFSSKMSHFLADAKQQCDLVMSKEKSTNQSLADEIDNLLQLVEDCKSKLLDGGNTPSSQIDRSKEFQALTKNLATFIQKSYRNFQVSHKEYHSSLQKLGKSIDKCMKTNQEEALLRDPWEYDRGVLRSVIVEHLFREGLFDVAESFQSEANVSVSDDYKQAFSNMFLVLQSLDQHDVTLALEWCREHSRQHSLLAFQCHKLQFIKLLQKSGIEAIQYARVNIAPFSSHQSSEDGQLDLMDEIKYLMGSVLYAGRLHQSEHYKTLLDPNLWTEVKELFKKECCSIAKLATESPLFIGCTAGALALPTLLKMINVTRLDRESLQKMEQLKVELEGVNNMFHFHSVFICPVSKEQYVSPDNPPMLLPCGHVLIKSSVQKMTRLAQQRFKCPYCPEETTIAQCKPINF